MKKLMSIMLLSAFSQVVFSAEPRPPLYTSPLPALPPNREVRMDELTLSPGADGPAHRHDAYVYVYVVEGTVDMEVEGGEVQHLSAGQVFTEAPDDIHTVMRNPSATQTARFVSFMIKTANAPAGSRIAPETP